MALVLVAGYLGIASHEEGGNDTPQEVFRRPTKTPAFGWQDQRHHGQRTVLRLCLVLYAVSNSKRRPPALISSDDLPLAMAATGTCNDQPPV